MAAKKKAAAKAKPERSASQVWIDLDPLAKRWYRTRKEAVTYAGDATRVRGPYVLAERARH